MAIQTLILSDTKKKRTPTEIDNKFYILKITRKHKKRVSWLEQNF